MEQQAPKTYCSFANAITDDKQLVHKHYHDNAYGFPIEDDNELFERLVLEINQAGLSWSTILNKQENFRNAYHQFEIARVAAYGESDFDRLMQDAGIIRNKLKINAAIENARTVLRLQAEFGSFKAWLDAHHPKSKGEWVKIFKKTIVSLYNLWIMCCQIIYTTMSDRIVIEERIDLIKELSAIINRINHQDQLRVFKNLIAEKNKEL